MKNMGGHPKYYRPLSTVLVLLTSGPTAELVDKVAREQQVELWRVRRATDLVAVGAIAAIVDPALIDEKTWRELHGWLAEMDDPHTKVLLVGPSPHKQTLPPKNLVRSPRRLDETFLKLLFVHQRSTFERRRRRTDKPERQIFRLMFALCQFDQGRVVRVRDLVEEFAVSRRTIQRDIELLAMVGYPVEDAGEPGAYRFVKGFRSHQLHFE